MIIVAAAAAIGRTTIVPCVVSVDVCMPSSRDEHLNCTAIGYIPCNKSYIAYHALLVGKGKPKISQFCFAILIKKYVMGLQRTIVKKKCSEEYSIPSAKSWFPPSHRGAPRCYGAGTEGPRSTGARPG